MLSLHRLFLVFPHSMDMLYFKCITFFETCLDTVYDTRPHQFTINFLFCLFIFYICSDTFVGSASFLIFPGCSITITSPHNQCDPQNFCVLRYIYNTIILWTFLFLFNLLVFVFASVYHYFLDSPPQTAPRHLPYTPPTLRTYTPKTPPQSSSPCSPHLSPISSPRPHIPYIHTTHQPDRPTHLPPLSR